MSKQTWFKLYRGWQDNPMFRSDKDKLCWLWLIENAVIDELTVSVNNRPVKIIRGQLCYSISFLAKAWGATPSYVRCFLKHLKLWQAIDTQNDKGRTLITICNYCKYQDKRTENDKGSYQNTPSLRQGNDNNTKNVKKEKEYKNISVPDFIDGDVWLSWMKHRKEIRKSLTPTQAEKQIEKLTNWHNENHNVNEIINQSITQGWTGLFKPKEKTNGKSRNQDIAEQTHRIIENGL